MTEQGCKVKSKSHQHESREDLQQSEILMVEEEKLTIKDTFRKHCDPIRIISGVLFLVIVIVVVVLFGVYTSDTLQAIKEFMIWVQENVALGVILYLVTYTMAIVILIPASIFTLGGAYVFGQVFGKFIGYFFIIGAAFTCDVIGGYIAFVISRTLFYDFLKPFLNNYKYLRAADRGMQNNGLKLMFLFRMCPLIPYNVFNYLIAITSVSNKDFLLGCLGILPHLFLNVYIVIQITDLDKIIEGNYNFGIGHIISLCVGVVLVALILWLIVVYTKRELNNELRETVTKSFIEEQARANPYLELKFQYQQQHYDPLHCRIRNIPVEQNEYS